MPNEGACLRYMMNRIAKRGGVLQIQMLNRQSPNKGACLRYMMNRNRQMRGRVLRHVEPESPNEGFKIYDESESRNEGGILAVCDEPVSPHEPLSPMRGRCSDV